MPFGHLIFGIVFHCPGQTTAINFFSAFFPCFPQAATCFRAENPAVALSRHFEIKTQRPFKSMKQRCNTAHKLNNSHKQSDLVNNNMISPLTVIRTDCFSSLFVEFNRASRSALFIQTDIAVVFVKAAGKTMAAFSRSDKIKIIGITGIDNRPNCLTPRIANRSRRQTVIFVSVIRTVNRQVFLYKGRPSSVFPSVGA